ncbi:nucleotide sugar dehydrogenase [Flagellatimonas centrodinii]|uniref:nucleotide sugar dehydrogenase n=1 Tax=Flagellatimonas centrodinii TaxID=2806210 RepID=UPI001FEDDBC9|nr:nucleotide sugar dehydrogenase [Flagellatimonas centrodinii]ULQ46707.1 nucleotide sugar dehydrogenase [Flagellatimonas centrodinii]
MLPTLQTAHIAVIGLGYVGLPLAAEFGKKYKTVGFDINAKRIDELRQGRDHTREMSPQELAEATQLRYTSNPGDIADCNIYIVTVPTPIDAHKRPDLTPLLKASETIGKVLKPGNIVIYESTVYPGATEEDCVPVLEKVSGLTYQCTERLAAASAVDVAVPPHPSPLTPHGFFCGYSPERINPGDKAHRLPDIKKVTSGSTPEVADLVDSLYASIITAGTYKASSIKVAEAAKVIENTQRDLNIALVNDLAILFNKLGIDTLEVLEAAGTKWNFLPFRPGLVGGHCISVDPYYLTHKAQEVGHHPDVILAGRRTNDGMGAYVASEVIRLMVRKGINPVNAHVLILGLAFKENCPDLRNTRVVDIIDALKGYNACVDTCDPWVDAGEAEHEYGLILCEPREAEYDAIVMAVGHDAFRDLGADGIRTYGKPGAVLYDVKYVLPRDAVDGRL